MPSDGASAPASATSAAAPSIAGVSRSNGTSPDHASHADSTAATERRSAAAERSLQPVPHAHRLEAGRRLGLVLGVRVDEIGERLAAERRDRRETAASASANCATVS